MIVNLLRWLLFIGFLAQIVGICYGVMVLSRIKREQRQLTTVLSTFADRSEQIAEAIRSVGKR